MHLLRAAWRRAPHRGVATDAAGTPAMQQYWSMRSDVQYAGCLLMYQMGQFMECFFDDARVLSDVLGVTCTHRGSHQGARIPMAGVPMFTHDAHVARLVRAGYRVALCEQAEGIRRPSSASDGGILPRSVTRVATRGTLIDSSILHARSHSFIAAISPRGGQGGEMRGLAWMDVSTGEAHARCVTSHAVSTLVAAIHPVEVVVPMGEQGRWTQAGAEHGAAAQEALYRSMDRAVREAVRLRNVVQSPEPTRMAARMSRPCVTLALPGMDTAHACTLAAWPETQFVPAGGGGEDLEAAAVAGLQSYVTWALRDAAPSVADAVRTPWQAASVHTSVHEDVPLLRMDAATRRALEITRPMHGRRRARGSLLHACDACMTAMGARLLDSRMCHPVADVVVINSRLDAVEWLRDRPDLLHSLRRHLTGMPDVERSLQRVKMSKYSVDDMLALRRAVGVSRRIAAMLMSEDFVTHSPRADSGDDAVVDAALTGRTDAVHAAWRQAATFYDGASPAVLQACTLALAAPTRTTHTDTTDPPLLFQQCAMAMQEVERALCDASPRDADAMHSTGVIQPGFSPTLDEWRRLRDDSEGEVAALQQRLRDATGVSMLKLRRLEDVGLIVEVPSRMHADIMRSIAGAATTSGADATLALRSIRSTKSAARFTCDAVIQLDQKISRAAAQVAAEEAEIMRQLVRHVCDAAPAITAVVRALAVLDVAASCACIALTQSFVRPVLVGGDDARAPFMHVTAGRHMVVERALLEGWATFRSDGVGGDEEDGPGDQARQLATRASTASARAFVPNDVLLGGAGTARCVVLAGANMGGKSTYLRQVAHIVILAQMGSFVPASSVQMSVVDALFTRIGAADDVTRDRSTFLVEMEEAAHILHHASQNSLVLVDEIGRGTSTLDGLALAWSILEHFVRVTRCRTVFATHMHELTAAAVQSGGDSNEHVRCMMMHAHEDGDEAPVLTHRLTVHPLYAAAAGTGSDCDAAWRSAIKTSFGVHVANMAGVPAPVVDRAKGILHELNESQAASAWMRAVTQLQLQLPAESAAPVT